MGHGVLVIDTSGQATVSGSLLTMIGTSQWHGYVLIYIDENTLEIDGDYLFQMSGGGTGPMLLGGMGILIESNELNYSGAGLMRINGQADFLYSSSTIQNYIPDLTGGGPVPFEVLGYVRNQ